VSTKTCPSCAEVVPAEATRCKHCFHDFGEAEGKKGLRMAGLLAFVLSLLVVGAAALSYVYYFNEATNVVVDEETRSIVITRKSASATRTERIAFDTIQKVEHVMGGGDAAFEVVAVLLDGRRYVLKASNDQPILGDAEHFAAVMEKPIEEVGHVPGMGGD
jgi:hypothetical protein